MDSYQGKCLCGAVTFAFTPPPIFCAHCHCRYCRGAHGAAFVTWVGVPEESFELSAGEDKMVWYASSKQSQRGFCSQCGTTMFYTSSLSPGEVHIALACVDDATGIVPMAHVFSDHAVDWMPINDELLQVDSENPLLAKYEKVP